MANAWLASHTRLFTCFNAALTLTVKCVFLIYVYFTWVQWDIFVLEEGIELMSMCPHALHVTLFSITVKNVALSLSLVGYPWYKSYYNIVPWIGIQMRKQYKKYKNKYRKTAVKWNNQVKKFRLPHSIYLSANHQEELCLTCEPVGICLSPWCLLCLFHIHNETSGQLLHPTINSWQLPKEISEDRNSYM